MAKKVQAAVSAYRQNSKKKRKGVHSKKKTSCSKKSKNYTKKYRGQGR